MHILGINRPVLQGRLRPFHPAGVGTRETCHLHRTHGKHRVIGNMLQRNAGLAPGFVVSPGLHVQGDHQTLRANRLWIDARPGLGLGQWLTPTYRP